MQYYELFSFQSCRYHIRVRPSSNIRLTFVAFDVTGKNGKCDAAGDYLELKYVAGGALRVGLNFQQELNTKRSNPECGSSPKENSEVHQKGGVFLIKTQFLIIISPPFFSLFCCCSSALCSVASLVLYAIKRNLILWGKGLKGRFS